MNRCAVISIVSIAASGTLVAGDVLAELSDVKIGGYLGETKAGRLLGAIERAEAFWNSEVRDNYSYVLSSSNVLNPGPTYEVLVKNGDCTVRPMSYLGKAIRDGKAEACGEWQSIEGVFAYARSIATRNVDVEFDNRLGYVHSITYQDGSLYASNFKSLCERSRT
jgi:hypothetical protein